ncbi:MAG TPA: hypothetical protein VF458_11795 [Ktedonobacteraceae bacterium]
MSNLSRLADLLRARNTVESNIANLLESSVNLGTVGEYIAATIFGITLVPATRGSESVGIFASQPLRGKTVDIQWYPRREGFLNVHAEAAPDYYLVLAGPKQESSTARALVNPWIITSVYLFDSQELLSALRERGVQIGSHTSVIAQLWERAEIFPTQHNPTLVLSPDQYALLQLFG